MVTLTALETSLVSAYESQYGTDCIIYTEQETKPNGLVHQWILRYLDTGVVKSNHDIYATRPVSGGDDTWIWYMKDPTVFPSALVDPQSQLKTFLDNHASVLYYEILMFDADQDKARVFLKLINGDDKVVIVYRDDGALKWVETTFK